MIKIIMPLKDFRIKNTPVLISILIVALAVCIFFIIGIHTRYGKEVVLLKEKIASISNARDMLKDALKKAVRKKREYHVSLQAEAERRKALDSQVAELISELSRQNIAADNLRSQLSGREKESYDLRLKVEQLNNEKGLLNERLGYFQKIQENLQKKIQRLLTRTKVELGEVVVKPSIVNGRVLKANRKYNFVIIDLGRNDGIKADMSVMAYRDNKAIGEIRIEKVYDEFSAGRAVFEWRENELDVGDIVKGID